MKLTEHKLFRDNKRSGGAALEYVLVSVFGLILTMTALSFVKKAIDEQITKVEAEIGIDLNTSKLDIFDG